MPPVAGSTNDSQTPKKNDSVKYLTFCRPDLGEIEEDEEEEEEEREEVEVQRPDAHDRSCGHRAGICMKPLENNPNWPLFITEAGDKAVGEMLAERAKRDQDRQALHVFNDFNAYGVTEVLQNILVMFNNEILKTELEPLSVWSIVEGLALFLNQDLMAWLMTDDPDSAAEIVAMFGTLLLTTLDMLKQHDLLTADSPIKNAHIIVGLFIRFVLVEYWAPTGRDIGANESGWRREAVRGLDNVGIELKLPKAMKQVMEHVEKLREEYKKNERAGLYERAASETDWTPEDDIDDETGNRKWLRWDWDLEWDNYFDTRQRHGKIGGIKYDITRWPRSQRAQYSLR